MQGNLSPSIGGEAPWNSELGRRILMQWMMAVMSSYVLTFLVTTALQGTGQGLNYLSLAFGAFVPVIAQWLVLQRYLPKLTWPRWLAATLLGGIIGGFAIFLLVVIVTIAVTLLFPSSQFVLDVMAHKPFNQSLVYLTSWVVVIFTILASAFYQWRTLAKHLSRDVLNLKWRWLLVRAAEGAMVGVLFLMPIAYFANNLVSTTFRFLLGAMIAGIGAVITGAVLARLLQSPLLPPTSTISSTLLPAEGYGQVYRVRRRVRGAV